MSINPKHCLRLSAATADVRIHPAYAEEAPLPPLHLPPGTDEAIFTREQLEYLEDLYHDTLRHHLRQFYALLRTVPPGVDITPGRVGLNAAILAKLLGLSEELAQTPWRAYRKMLHYNEREIRMQRLALIERLRTLTKR